MQHLSYAKWFLVVCCGLTLGLASYAASARPTILVVGDSLSAAYGIEQSAGWVNLLQSRLTARHYPHQVVNASISGDTTSGALARLTRALNTARPGIVIIELGGNDGLRGLPLAKMRSNLAALIEQCLERNAQVLLIGMRLPPNYGPSYTKRFHEVYTGLAKKYGVPLLPFLLEGVAGDTNLMQADGVHPRAIAQTRVLNNVWDALQPMLDKTKLTDNKTSS